MSQMFVREGVSLKKGCPKIMHKIYFYMAVHAMYLYGSLCNISERGLIFQTTC